MNIVIYVIKNLENKNILNPNSLFILLLYLIMSIPLLAQDNIQKQMKAINSIADNIQIMFSAPTVWIEEVNSTKVGLYEKFEIKVGLSETNYSNPYDPDQIDLRAIFISPMGKRWEIIGFYDNYQNVDQWKVRFAPNELGEWTYYLTAKDLNGTGQSTVNQFIAIPSVHHGWIHVSENNPRYLAQDDGTSFYGVGMCYPWNVNLSGINRMAANGANIFFYWNGTYDGSGNGGGEKLIESVESGLGRYDQQKCARMDQLIDWAEESGVKMALVLWPHDYLADEITGGWVKQWKKTPYKNICLAKDFYGSELAWEYQKKQYRYIIARWGYSRGLAIWQVICEITGTDGWVFGDHNVAEQWCVKIHQFFKQNDPFDRPTTGSQHGYVTCDWRTGYQIFDLPNREIYESHGWSSIPSNKLQSSYLNYVKVTRELWQGNEKPIIVGETGYSHTFVTVGTKQYTKLYHNALWASLTNGLAGTPFWWDYNSSQIVTNEVIEQMNEFSKFVENIDFVNNAFIPAEVFTANCDAFGMKSDSIAFGWVRHIEDLDVSGQTYTFKGLTDGTYQITWFDTWTGEKFDRQLAGCFANTILDVIPNVPAGQPDVAFMISPAESGGEPAKLALFATNKSLLIGGNDTTTITCLIKDDQNRFCSFATNEILFELNGAGSFSGNNLIQAQNGAAKIDFVSGQNPGNEIIVASSTGLTSDTLEIEIKNYMIIEDFEQYTSQTHLMNHWTPYSGTNTTITLYNVDSGSFGMKMAYSVGIPAFAGAYKAISMDWCPFSGLKFWIKADGSGRMLTIMFKEGNGKIWSYDYALTGNEGTTIEIPFDQFSLYFGSGEMDLSNISQLILYITKETGEDGSGELYFDNFEVLTSLLTNVEKYIGKKKIEKFLLFQNYPNPFNPVTTISFQLPILSIVELTIYNVSGEKIKTLVHNRQQAGNYTISFDGSDLTSGLYFYQLKAGDFIQTRKMVFTK